MERRRASGGDPKAEASARSGQALKKANHPPSGVKGRAGKISVVASEGTQGFLHGLTNSPGMGVRVVKQCSRANLVWITGFIGMNRAIAPEEVQMTGH